MITTASQLRPADVGCRITFDGPQGGLDVPEVEEIVIG